MYIFEISVFGLHIAPTWYGLMYAIGFIFCYTFVGKYKKLEKERLDTLLLYIFFGVVGGGRIGYVLLYNPIYFLENPSEILALWNGGMSFHGGLLGVLIAVYLFSRRYKYRFFEITDILAVCLPIALGLGRVGNYINKELPGYTPYHGPFAMNINGSLYFPSPLLEMFFEGIILFGMLFFIFRYTRAIQTPGILSSIFLVGYALSRMVAEQFRLPDTHIGYIFGTDWLTLGLLYTVPMLIAGIVIFLYTKTK